jgi:deazaflavin-dependent oxidoreductase (nitroreductase family)
MASAALKDALATASEVDLTVTGRTSGRAITNPVWFVLDGDTLHLIPVGGADSDWYRNVLENPTIRIAAGGAEATAEAAPVTDRGSVNAVVDAFHGKYGDDVDRYYPKREVAVDVPLA